MRLTHIYPDNMPEILDRLNEGHTTIVPLRPPCRNAASWKAREKNLVELEGLWETMISVIAPYNPVYLPIESENRDVHLERVSKAIGERLQTEWPVIASSGRVARLTAEEEETFRRFDWFYDEVSRP